MAYRESAVTLFCSINEYIGLIEVMDPLKSACVVEASINNYLVKVNSCQNWEYGKRFLDFL